MGNFYDESYGFYDENQHYYDIEVKNFKDALRKEVKQEFLDEMERLRKENLELQEIKQNLKQIKSDYQKELEKEQESLREARRRVKQERFEELFKDVTIPITVYGIDTATAYKPLCGHCDNRVIHFNSPSGKELTEICPECGLSFSKWIVFPLERSKICIREEDHRCWSIYEKSIHTEWDEREWQLKRIKYTKEKLIFQENKQMKFFISIKMFVKHRNKLKQFVTGLTVICQRIWSLQLIHDNYLEEMKWHCNCQPL